MNLVGVLVAAGIGIVVMLNFSKGAKSLLSSTTSISNLQDETHFKATIGPRISCPQTVVPSPSCLASYTLKDKVGNTIPSQVGIYKLRNKCDAGELVVEFQSTKKDPTLKALPPWKRVYPAGAGKCASEISGTAAAAQTCPPGNMMTGLKADGSIQCASTTVAQTCPPTHMMTGLKADGSIQCASKVCGAAFTTVSGGAGLTATCPVGEFIGYDHVDCWDIERIIS